MLFTASGKLRLHTLLGVTELMAVCMKKGVTLLELVIASFILLLLTVTLYEIMITGLTVWRHSSKQQSNEQNAIIAANRLFFNLKITAATSITTFTFDGTSVTDLNYINPSVNLEDDPASNTGISFRSPLDPATNQISVEHSMGKLKWHKYLIYYVKNNSLLCQREISLGSRTGEVNSTPLELFDPPRDILYYITTPVTADIEERVITRNVMKLFFSHYPLNQVEFFIEIGQKETEDENASNRTSKVKVMIPN